MAGQRAAGGGGAGRALVLVARIAGGTLTFALAAAAGVALHLDLPATRRLIVREVDGVLAGSFAGTVRVNGLDGLRLDRLDGVSIEVLDPEGRRVLLAEGVHARIATAGLVRSLFTGAERRVTVSELSVDHLDALVEADAAGDYGIQRAFAPRGPPAPGPAAPGTLHLAMPAVTVRHGRVHGRVAPSVTLDVDLDDLAGSVLVTPRLTTLGLDCVRVAARGLGGASPTGALAGRLAVPAADGQPTVASVRYEGAVGAIPLVASASLDGSAIDVTIDVPRAEPAALRAISPAIPLTEPVRAHVEARGTLPWIAPVIQLSVGQGSIEVNGLVTLPLGSPPPELRADLAVRVKDLDARALSAAAPSSRLDASLDVVAAFAGASRLRGSFALRSAAGTVAGQVVPAAAVSGSFTERSAAFEARVAEPGAPITLRVHVEPKALGSGAPGSLRSGAPDGPRPPGPASALPPLVASFDGGVTVDELSRVPRLGPVGRGRVHVHVEGRADLDERRLTARATGEVGHFSRGGLRLESATLHAQAEGPFDGLRVGGSLDGRRLEAGGYVFASARAAARGTLGDLGVTASLAGEGKTPSVSARAEVQRRGGLALRAVELRVQRETEALDVRVASVRFAGSDLRVDGAVIEGAGGRAGGSAVIGPDAVTVAARGEGLDLHRLGRLLAPDQEVKSGTLAFDVAVRVDRGTASGQVRADLTGGSADGIDGVSAHVDASLRARRLDGEVAIAVPELGAVRVSAAGVELGGGAFAASSWRTATGSVTLATSVDLGKAFARVPDAWRPLGALAGRLDLKAIASRTTRAGNPDVWVAGETAGLSVAGKSDDHPNPDGTVTRGKAPWGSTGLDAAFDGWVEGRSGKSRLVTGLRDAHGGLARLDVAATVPIDALLATGATGATGAPVRELLERLPVEAHVAVLRRRLDQLPKALGDPPVKGEVELTLDATGTALAPHVELSAQGHGLLPRDAIAGTPAFEVDAQVSADADGGKVDLRVARGAVAVMTADATVKLKLADLRARAPGGPLPWDASGAARFTGFPLAPVAGLAGQPIEGTVDGTVDLRDLHRAAGLEVNLALRDVKIDRARFPSGAIRVAVEDGKGTASVRLDQSDGFAEARAEGAVGWGAALAPSVDAARPVEVYLTARNFRANAAYPLVRDSFSELDGRVKADVHLHAEPDHKGGRADGAIEISGGVFEMPVIGEEFHDVRATVVMKPWGTLRLDGLSAQGLTGRLTGSATAQLDGLTLQHAEGSIQIAKGEKVPLTLEGQSLGAAWGTVHAKARMDGDALGLEVEVPQLHVELPQSTGHAVQPLDDDSHVRVGVHEQGGQLAVLPLRAPVKPRAPSALRVHVAVHLGDDVGIKRDTTLDLALGGTPVVDIADRSRISGELRLARGSVEVEGKRFLIDKGTVSFTGQEPGNPVVNVTAAWDAPDGTRVFADFVGPLKTGKLTLRAEPTRTQDEIVALILFGTADGSFGASAPPGRQESTGLAAAGLAGGVVTQGLNRAIAGVTTVDLETRVDTSEQGNPRPELMVRIAKNLSAQLAYNLGVPAPGQNPDRTLVTIDWRLVRRWALDTTVGDKGSTSVDLLWRYRY